MKLLGIPFEVRPTEIEELFDLQDSPEGNARRLAVRKADAVARHIRYATVVGADTVVILDGEVLGKPGNPEHAKQMLRKLSGQDHRVCTAFAIVDMPSGSKLVEQEITRVKFRMLEEGEIEDYVARGSSMDKAGAYGIQEDYGAVFVERIDGCFYNVVGFPLTKFFLTFKRFQSAQG